MEESENKPSVSRVPLNVGLWITFKQQIPFLVACLTWFLLWLAGCVIFDAILELKGGWLMLAGAGTMKLCVYVAEKIDP